MAATALEMMTLYLLMSQGTKFDVESSFQESNIVPDVISTAPPIAAEVCQIMILIQVVCYGEFEAFKLILDRYTTFTYMFKPVVNVL